MASPCIPRLKVETGSGPEQPTTVHGPIQVLLGCDAKGKVVDLEPPTGGNDTSMYEDDCSPAKELVEHFKDHGLPTGEALSLPVGNDRTFLSEDRPIPQCARSCCNSPSPTISRAVSIDGDCTRSVSPCSSNTTAGSLQVEVDVETTPCDCPFVEARRMTEEAKEAVVEHYKDYAQIYTHPDGQQIPLIRGWMRSTIDRNLEVGYTTAVYKMKSIAKAASLGDWPTHCGGESLHQRCYQDSFQPWMRVLMHRTMKGACQNALSDIDQREGIRDDQRPPFHLDVPNVIDPAATRFPCLCKEAHTISIATKILEETMTSLAPLISMLATRMPRKGRQAIHSRVWHRIYAQLQRAMCRAFEDVMEDSDIGQCCAEHEMTHVQPWMTKVIRQHCEEAARSERKALQWRARDMQIKRFQRWLEQLYLEDEDDAQRGESKPEEENGGGYQKMQIVGNENN